MCSNFNADMVFKVKIALLFLLCFSGFVSAQSVADKEAIFLENLSNCYKDPDKGFKIAHYLLDNANDNDEKVQGLYLISEISFLKDDYKQSVESLFEAYRLLDKSNNNFLKTFVLTSISSKCSFFGLTDKSDTYIEQAEEYSNLISQADKKALARAKVLYEKGEVLVSDKKFSEAIRVLSSSYTIIHPYKNKFYGTCAKIQCALGNAYFNTSDYIGAKQHYQRTIDILKIGGLEFSSIAASAYNGIGEIALKGTKLGDAKTAFEKALSCKVIETEVKADAYYSLSQIYLKQGDDSKYKENYKLYKANFDNLSTLEREARNTLIAQIEKEHNVILKKNQTRYTYLLVVIIFVFIVAFGIYFFYNKKLDKEYKKFERLLIKIEKDREEAKKEVKVLTIPEKTEQAILDRLKEFENGKEFTNPNMSVQFLSKKMKTNSKYLSEIINKHKGKNFNAYINDLRIDYIIDMMQTDPKFLNYKVSYLAENCGFASHSVFTVVFKSVTNLTPKQFISFLKKKTEKEREVV